MRVCCLVVAFCLSLFVQAQDRSLLILGDSISAGYGISLEQGWVHLLEKRLRELGYRYRVENASISGDTTGGALIRLEGLLADRTPDIAIVELGGNDGLRGLSLDAMAANLERIAARLKRAGSRVLLVPMRLPPNYGPAYNRRFEKIYRDIADRLGVDLTTFILRDIAGVSELMQSDGIHPRAEAQSLMLDNIWSALQPLLQQDGAAVTGTESG